MSGEKKGAGRTKRQSFAQSVLSREGLRDIRVVAGFRIATALFTAVALVSVAFLIGRTVGGSAVSVGVRDWVLPLGAAFLAGLAAFGEIRYGGSAARKEEKRVRHRLMATVFDSASLPKNNASESDSGTLITLMTDNAERLTEYRQVYFGATVAAIAIPFLTLGYVAIAFDPVVGFVLMAFCPLIPLLIGVFMSFFRKTSANSRKERGKLAGQYLDAIRNLVTIRLLGAGPRIEKHLREQGEKNRGAIMKLLAGNQIVIIVMDGLFSLLLICAAAFLTVLRFNAGALTASEAIAIMLLTTLLIEPLVQVAGFFYIGMGGMASERAIGRYLAESKKSHGSPKGGDETTEATTSSTTESAPGNSGGIDIRDISFDYGRGDVLHDVSLSIPQGSKVAIVGRSGEGKSTLLSIVRGSLPLQRGSLSIGHTNVTHSSASEIRSLSATVSQSTWLFTGTIADNLRLADPDATDDDMWNALRRAHLADDVERMPDRLQTDVGEQGARISGGQAQRLSLARALLSGRKILLLDEPTSQVDRESERRIISAIKDLGPEWTLLIVTHRRSLLEVVDNAYEMRDGRLSPLALTQGGAK